MRRFNLSEWALANRFTTLALALAMFIGSLALVPLIGFSVFPPADIPQFRITIETPDGASVADTDRALRPQAQADTGDGADEQHAEDLVDDLEERTGIRSALSAKRATQHAAHDVVEQSHQIFPAWPPKRSARIAVIFRAATGCSPKSPKSAPRWPKVANVR